MPKAHNSKILESLKDPKVQKELEPLMKEFSEAQKKEEEQTFNTISLFFGVLLIIGVVAVVAPIFEDYLDGRRQNDFIEWYKKQN